MPESVKVIESTYVRNILIRELLNNITHLIIKDKLIRRSDPDVRDEVADGVLEGRVLHMCACLTCRSALLPSCRLRLAHKAAGRDVRAGRAFPARTLVKKAVTEIGQVTAEARVVRKHTVALVLEVVHQEPLSHNLTLTELQDPVLRVKHRRTCLYCK